MNNTFTASVMTWCLLVPTESLLFSIRLYRVEKQTFTHMEIYKPGSGLWIISFCASHVTFQQVLFLTLNIRHAAFYSWNILSQNHVYRSVFSMTHVVWLCIFGSVVHVSLPPASVWYFDDSLWSEQHLSGRREGVILACVNNGTSYLQAWASFFPRRLFSLLSRGKSESETAQSTPPPDPQSVTGAVLFFHLRTPASKPHYFCM